VDLSEARLDLMMSHDYAKAVLARVWKKSGISEQNKATAMGKSAIWESTSALRRALSTSYNEDNDHRD